MRPVKSTDNRKKQIMNAIKAKSGANKVTIVKELKDGSFQGHAMKGNRTDGYKSLGMVNVTAEEAGIHVITLSNQDFDILASTINDPPQPNEKLKEAFSKYNELVKK